MKMLAGRDVDMDDIAHLGYVLWISTGRAAEPPGRVLPDYERRRDTWRRPCAGHDASRQGSGRTTSGAARTYDSEASGWRGRPVAIPQPAGFRHAGEPCGGARPVSLRHRPPASR